MKLTAVALWLAAGISLLHFPAHANLLSADDERIYQQAFRAARSDQFDVANKLAATAKNPLPAKVVRWLDLIRPRSGATFGEITAFIGENPDWPQSSVMQRRAEEAITVVTPDSSVIAWFSTHPPLTADGSMAYGKALLAAGRTEKATEVLRDAWVQGNFGVLQERQFLALFKHLIRNHDHVARLDRLLWDRLESAAQRMILRVDTGHRHLAQARIALMNVKGGAEAAIAKVPPELQDDPGLIYERVRWRRQKDLDAEAIQLLDHKSRNKVRPDMWWAERAILARRSLQTGRITQAYRIARDHGQSEGAGFADAEWLAGWIALRFLDDREVAASHFKRLYEKVSYPVSRSRGAYWAGRAAQAMGDAAGADHWYGLAARHITTFYGQLASARMPPDRQWPLPADPLPTAEDIERFDRRDLTNVTRMLVEIGETDAVRSFFVRLHDMGATPGERALAANLASSLGRPDIAVALARRSDRDGITLVSSGFPIPAIEAAGPPEQALVLALIRQESAFHHEAISTAGARGLMQLLPTTAEKVAKTLRVAFTKNKLTEDPSFNVKLGSAYLSDLLADFNGSYILALAAYNAGPSRARKWVRDYGDPRDKDVDAVDWVEQIPFSETRNYVQRVLENVQVYRRRLGTTELTFSLESDLKR